MKSSMIFPKTRHQDPKDASSPGTRLMLRAGYFDYLASGILTWTFLGLKVRRRVEQIVREEMDGIGAQEMELPILHPRELWEQTGRWEKYRRAGIAFTLTDRRQAQFILAPTAEEPITDFARRQLRSYRDLPVTFYQISPKFRDELRPRQGLIRGREFLMKDAYSFAATEEQMNQDFQAMRGAYARVMQRCGFDFIEVEADSGSIGGKGSSEFMALAASGEDTLLYCPACHYGGNQEKASAYYPPYPDEALAPLQKIDTPNIRTVEELEAFVSLPASKMVKTIVMSADGVPVIVSMRGDLEISETKLANLLGVSPEVVETADDATVIEVTKAPVGFAGPIGLFGQTAVRYFFDQSVKGLRNFLCGGNQEDVHYLNVNTGRDFPEPEQYHDLAKADGGLHCSNCQTGLLEIKRGIEIGHIFMLQQGYSKAMNATFDDGNGHSIPFWMGCYGIGISRIVQAVVEQRNDDRGIVWPLWLAPFKVVVIPANQEHRQVAEEFYRQLTRQGIEVLFDDRDARIGEKLTDAELLGIPLQVIFGRLWKDKHRLEVKWRNQTDFDSTLFSIQKPGSLPQGEFEPEVFVNWLLAHH